MLRNNPLILIVDDEINLCDALCRIIEGAGCRVMATTDGAAALRLMEEERPDVILLDVMMPGMSGTEVCRQVRKRNRETQIIYFTAKVDLNPSRAVESYMEADAVILKPASGEEILSKINSLLSAGISF